MSEGQTPPQGRRQRSKVFNLQLESAKCVTYNTTA